MKVIPLVLEVVDDIDLKLCIFLKVLMILLH